MNDTIMLLIIGGLGAVAWWFFTDKFDRITDKIDKIAESLSDYKVKVAEQMVSKSDCKICKGMGGE